MSKRKRISSILVVTILYGALALRCIALHLAGVNHFCKYAVILCVGYAWVVALLLELRQMGSQNPCDQA